MSTTSISDAGSNSYGWPSSGDLATGDSKPSEPQSRWVASDPTAVDTAALPSTATSQVTQQKARPVYFVQPTEREQSILNEFTPGGYKPSQFNTAVDPNNEDRNGAIGGYNLEVSQYPFVYERAAIRQAAVLGVDPKDYVRGIALQERSHMGTLDGFLQLHPVGKSDKKLDSQSTEVIGDAVTAAAYPDVGALSSLYNALDVHRGGKPDDSYRLINSAVESALQQAFRQAGSPLKPGVNAVGTLYASMGPKVKANDPNAGKDQDNKLTYRQALQQFAADKAKRDPSFDAKKFENAVMTLIPQHVQQVAREEKKKLEQK
jgi:hypothetical protein